MALANRKIRPPLDPREWLEDMRRFNGRDAQFATEVLQMLDDAQDSEKLIEEYGERVGDIDDAESVVLAMDGLRVWAERDPTFREFGDVDVEGLERFARAYDKLEEQADALRDLCVEAGLIGPRDHTTDPLPLLRMFLPVD